MDHENMTLPSSGDNYVLLRKQLTSLQKLLCTVSHLRRCVQSFDWYSTSQKWYCMFEGVYLEMHFHNIDNPGVLPAKAFRAGLVLLWPTFIVNQ